MGGDQQSVRRIRNHIRIGKWKWIGAGSAGSAGSVAASAGTLMAQPSVRAKAMGDKDQNQVWAEVRKQQQAMTVEVTAGPSPANADEIRSTSSYARVMEKQRRETEGGRHRRTHRNTIIKV